MRRDDGQVMYKINNLLMPLGFVPDGIPRREVSLLLDLPA